MATFLGNRKRDTQYSAALFRTRPLGPFALTSTTIPRVLLCNALTIMHILYRFVQFGRPLSHSIFSDAGFERLKYVLIF